MYFHTSVFFIYLILKWKKNFANKAQSIPMCLSLSLKLYVGLEPQVFLVFGCPPKTITKKCPKSVNIYVSIAKCPGQPKILNLIVLLQIFLVHLDSWSEIRNKLSKSYVHYLKKWQWLGILYLQILSLFYESTYGILVVLAT